MVQFAPLRIPFERRKQTMAVMFFTSLFLVIPFSCCILFIIALFSQFSVLALGYLVWIIYDNCVLKSPQRGSRRSPYFRRLSIWRHLRNYFPVNLVKTSELTPEKNYLFGYHPHGVMSAGCFVNFATEATGFSEKFPGIRSYPLTLTTNFRWPLLRGALLWLGACDVSKETIQFLLTRNGTGNAPVVVVGGADEALKARPGNYDLTLKNRKGFVKMAIKTGASLVPVFSFGENDIFFQAENPEGSLVRRFQESCKKLFGISPVFFYARGVFNYSFGFLPYRKPVHTIIGRPVDVPHDTAPGQAVIDRVHQQYMNELSRMFDENKTKYGIDNDTRLNFL